MPYSKKRERVCQECGKHYILGVDSTQHKYCSIQCRSKYHNKHGGKKYRNSEKGKITGRRWRLLKDFNLSLEDYQSLLASQNNSCKICEVASPSGYNWHVDHSHKTGKVRGILCSKCNQGLGLFQDSTTLLEKAKKYLEDCKS